MELSPVNGYEKINVNFIQLVCIDVASNLEHIYKSGMRIFLAAFPSLNRLSANV